MTRDSHAPHCNRTADLVDRIVDDRLRPDDREHAARCPRCGPVLMHAQRFEDELRRVAEGFVAEELPRGILDPGLAATPTVNTRSAGPGLAGIVAAVAVLVVAMTVTFRPGGPGDRTPAPTTGAVATPGVSEPAATPGAPTVGVVVPPLRTTGEIGGALIGLDWTCSAGGPSETAGTGVDNAGIVCLSPKSELLAKATVVTGESIDGAVLDVAVMGELVVGTSNAIAELAQAMSKAAYLSIGDDARASLAGDWVLTKLPDLEVQSNGDQRFAIFGDVRLTLQLAADGTYFLRIQAEPH
ncbi:MAG TPA: hypothetical protein VNL94_09365 [Candidatus Binatia bacterium]|nr:hypothetical protein [Candidatus Binatia bacterium]